MNRRLHKHDKQSRGRQALAGQRQPQWQCAKCYTRNFLSKDNCRECGKVKELQKDSYVDERGLIAPWPRQSGGGMTSRAASRPASTAKGPAQVLAQTRHQLAQARGAGDAQRLHPCFGVQSDERRGRDETSSAHGTEDGPGASQISSSGRGGREGTKKPCSRPRRTSSKRSRRSVQAQLDLHELTQEAPLPVMPALQVNVNLVKSWEALTGLVENMVESGGRTTTRPTDPRNPRVKGDSSHLISNPVPGRRRSCGGRDGRRPGPGRGRSRRDGRLRGGARSRRAASGAEADTQGCGGTRTPNAATAKEDANNRAGGFERGRSTFAGSTQIADVQNEGQAQGERVVQLVALRLGPAEPWQPTQMRVHASERDLLERELRRDVLGDSDVWNSLRGGVQRWGGDG